MAKNKGTEHSEVDASQFTEEENLGFPPYWNPTQGGSVIAKVSHLDDADEEFVRWVFQALQDTACKKGPADDAEEVIVKRGEFFSVSNYAQLRLTPYIDMEVMLIAEDKVDIGKGHTMWNFKMRVSKETKALLTQRRMGGGNSLPQASAPRAISQQG